MERISMTPKELLVLASKLGAITFYGLQDPFRGMSRAEIKAAIPRLQQQAERRGLAAMGFEQDFNVAPEAAELITICIKCERYMTVDVMVDGTRQPREVIYQYEGGSVLLQDHTEEVVLQKVDANALQDRIYRQYFSKCAEFSPQDQDVRLPPMTLTKLRTLDDGDGIEQLKGYGCAEELAESIMQGLHGRCPYISLIRVDVQNSSCISLLSILSNSGIVRLWLENDAGEEFCHANWIGRQDAENALAEVFQGF